jgi:V/A-type H+-transporting ATPase subunit C
MQHLRQYQKTADLGPMMAALQGYYYSALLEALKFFQGDEGVIRELVRAEIDKKNILSLLKAKETNLEKEIVVQHLIEGGNISTRQLGEMYMVKNVEELARNIDIYYKLEEGFEQYKKTRSLTDFEAALDKVINEMYFKRLKTISLSIGTIFYFVILAERELENIRKIVYGKHYDLPVERISSMLVFG